jgi:Concanavalin A-like lectin/glucanases superfamily
LRNSVKVAIAAATAVMVVIFALPAMAGASAKLTADYRFEGNLRSSAGNAPKLHEFNTGDGSFHNQLVKGSRQGVWSFPEGDGLRMGNADKVLGHHGRTYTFALLVNLDAVDGYRKLIDFDNLQQDAGWYVYEQSLYPYDLSDFDYSRQRVQAGAWRQIVLTRGANGVVRGYVGGKKIGRAGDPGKDEALGPDKVLYFLMDDGSTTSEESGGRVARLRIYDNALSREKIKHLGT